MLGSVVLALIAIVGGVMFVMSRLNAPHQGVVHVGAVIQPSATFDMTPKPAQGTYVTFAYPAGLTVVPNNPIVKPVLEQFNFIHRDIETWNLAIAVLTNPGDISTNNAYQYRKTKPSEYKESQLTVNGRQVVIMTDTSVGGFSEVAFLQHGPYGATISLYGDDQAGTQALANTFHMILSTWSWK